MDKDQVAEILVSIGTLLELKGENPFKTRAYENAARAIEALNEPLAKVVAENRLGDIKGIGDALQKKITELVTKVNPRGFMKTSFDAAFGGFDLIFGGGHANLKRSPIRGIQYEIMDHPPLALIHSVRRRLVSSTNIPVVVFRSGGSGSTDFRAR